MKYNITICLMMMLLVCKGQENNTKFNLDFESYTPGKAMPTDWGNWMDYAAGIDSLVVYSGKYSGKITSGNGGDGGFLVYAIPYHYRGDTITLEGFMKTENVKSGYAGFFLRLDANGGPLVSDMMNNQNIQGTNDWKKYTLTLPIPKGVDQILLGTVLTGTGKAWYDNILIKINGKNIQTLQKTPQKVFPADMDNEFDVGSNIQSPKLNKGMISNLGLLGQLWGFLKYYHPEIGKGNYNWDYELFRILSDYMTVTQKKERDAILLNVIEKLGEITACKNCPATNSTAFLKPDFSWTKKLSPLLRSKLKYIYENRHQGEHYYIKSAQLGNPIFSNEDPYVENPYPDVGFRLLSLFRYWNGIHYFFPYKHLTDKDWNAVLTEYIPIFIHAKNELEYELAVTQLIGEIGDSHGIIWSGDDKIQQERGGFHAPFRVKFIGDKLVVTSYYNPELKDALNVGDVITHINGRPIRKIVRDIRMYYPASNESRRNLLISLDLLRSKKNRLVLTYTSGREKKEKTIPLYERRQLNIYEFQKPRNKKSHTFLNDSIGYVSLQNIKEDEIEYIKKEFQETKGLILDIRNYPSLDVIYFLAPYFVSSPTPYVTFTKFNISNFGEFNFTQPDLLASSTSGPYKGKLVVLVNEISHSAAEYAAMAFRAGDNTTIVGSTTSGADGNISGIKLPGNIQTVISGIGVYYPNGTETQRIGIVPDIVVKPTIQGIMEGRDEVLEKAIETINVPN